MREKFRQLGKESLIYGVSGMLQKFIAVLLVPLYWNVFSESDMGQVALVVSVITLASAFAVLGMDSAAATWFWQSEVEEDRKMTMATWFWCQMAVSLLLGGLLALFAPQISILISGDETPAPLLRLAAVTLPLTVAGTVLTNYFRLRRRAVPTLWFVAGTSLLLVVLNLLFILCLHWGMAGFFLAQITAGVCSTIAALWLLRHTIHPRLARLPRLREMLRFALPLVPAALALWVMALSDRLFLKNFFDFSEVGLYDAGARLATAVAIVTGAFTTAWGPFALSMQRQADAPALYARALLVYLALGGAMVTAVALFTPEALQVLAKPSYAGAAPVVGILTLGILANGLASIASTGLALAKKSAPVAGAVFIAAGVSVALNFILIPWLGIIGAAWASGVSWIVYAAWIFLRAQRIHPLPYDLSRSLLIGAMLVGIVLLAPQLHAGTQLMEVLLKLVVGLAFVLVLFTVALPGWPAMLRRGCRAA